MAPLLMQHRQQATLEVQKAFVGMGCAGSLVCAGSVCFHFRLIRVCDFSVLATSRGQTGGVRRNRKGFDSLIGSISKAASHLTRFYAQHFSTWLLGVTMFENVICGCKGDMVL